MSSQWTELANHFGAQYAVPPALILALIDMESGGDPNDVNPRSHATGLMQVTKVVLRDYNKRHGKSYTLEDLKDPELNIKIGAELLRRISMAYQKHNALQPSWGNTAYVGLVVLGWNAGYSRASGVSYVLTRLQAAGIPRSQWNIRTVVDASKKLENASQYLKSRSPAWAFKVVETYSKITKRAGRRVAQAERKAEGKEWSGTKKVLVYGGVAAGTIGLGYWLWNKHSEKVPEYVDQPQLSGMPNIIVVK